MAIPVFAATYIVQPGDSLYLISQRYGISIQELKEINGLRNDYLQVGQVVQIPSKQGGSVQTGQSYTVRSGDTLFLIAQRFGVTVADLRSANNLSGDLIMIGQVLTIPGKGTSPAPVNPNNPAPMYYTVRPGDTLYLIAQRLGTTVAALRTANDIWTDYLYVGQQLVIPGKSGSGSTNPNNPGGYKLSPQEFDLLARLVTAEAGGEPYIGQVAVAATVLNRVKDPRYPNTVTGVIYQVTNGIYQYEPVKNGYINMPATASAKKAVEEALAGNDPSKGANGFYNPQTAVGSWVRSQPVTVVIGNHVFFKS
ncbi:MAG: LysM peptidoglycan-binding domain-containing protein [Firmicutes bacterium]|nr:LysM peptidoglycan-binding domain-containing protein [Bacillota bacterium]